MDSAPNTPTPVMHKSAVPANGMPKHTFMFKNSPAAGRSSPGSRKTVQSAEDLVSVTVRKDEPSQKAGISLVERQNGTYITKVDPEGLFHDTEIQEGDKVLSINGKRLKQGEGAKHIIKTITKAKATVTMVVKKHGVSPTRGSRGGRIKKKPNTIFKKDIHRKEDHSLDPDHDPRILRQDTDAFDQIPIKATKIYREQSLGLSIVEYNNMIFISDISLESPFRDTNLRVGDRVVGVGSMNFMSYADAALAKKMAEKAPKEVEIVVEKGHKDMPDDVKKRMEEITMLKSPSPPDTPQRELDVDDLITPRAKKSAHKKFNASFSGPFRTPKQRDAELDRDDILQTPKLPLNNSFNASSLSEYATPKQEQVSDEDLEDESDVSISDEEDNNASFVLADRVLARQAKSSKSNAVTKNGHNSWSHCDQGEGSSHSKNRKGKQPATPNKSKSVKTSPRSKFPEKKSSKLGLEETSDESSLDEEIEKSLTNLKKKANFHNSWSHPDHKKLSPGSSKKGKRLPTSSTTKKASNDDTGKPIKFKSKPKPKPVTVESVDGESSMEEDLQAAAAEMLSPERKAKHISSMSFNKSLSQMNPEDYDGDIIRIRVKKKSESDPGIKVHKTAGIFILTKLPTHEKRINIGSQVLAINGVMNINTVVKAESLMKQTKEFVTLMVDFSSPIDRRRNCPCCGDSLYPNGEHVRSKEPDDSGLFTPRTSNHSDHRPKKKLLPSKYNVDDYNSDTDEDGDEGRSVERSHTAKFQPGDKFMIRVKTNGNSGISLFDYKKGVHVGKIEKGGAFYSTPIDTGDKVISINGKKMDVIKTASNAMTMMEEKETVSLYVCRCDKSSGEYKEAIKRAR